MYYFAVAIYFVIGLLWSNSGAHAKSDSRLELNTAWLTTVPGGPTSMAQSHGSSSNKTNATPTLTFTIIAIPSTFVMLLLVLGIKQYCLLRTKYEERHTDFQHDSSVSSNQRYLHNNMLFNMSSDQGSVFHLPPCYQDALALPKLPMSAFQQTTQIAINASVQRPPPPYDSCV